jgi:hypothetical protein
METKQELLTLNGKEYLLDIEQAKQLGLLKEKDNKVKSWKEFINKHLESKSFYCNDGTVNQTISPYGISEQLTRHEAKAIAAFSKLLKLRRDWIGEWEPNWETTSTNKYVIEYIENRIRTYTQWTYARSLSFPTQQMAHEFLETFRDLIEEAKILI